MPYRKEVFRKGFRFHVYNRGFRRQQLFYDTNDYQRFLNKLSAEIDQDFTLYAYVLMPNHFHLLFELNTEISLSQLLRNVQLSYAKYYSLKYKKRGSVFESRFKAKRIDSKEYLLKVVHYIHQNPLVAGLVRMVDEWRWSSYWSYIGEVSDGCVSSAMIMDVFRQQYENGDFRKFSQDINMNPDEGDILIDSPTLIQSRDC